MSTEAAPSREPFTVAPNPNFTPPVQQQPQSQTQAVPQQQMEHQHQHQHQQQQMHMPPQYSAYGPPVGSSPPPPTFNQSMSAGASSAAKSMSSGEKRRRGRPRKYGPDGNMAPGQQQQQQPIGVVAAQIFSSPPAPNTQLVEAGAPISGSASPTVKKSRGRPPGSSNKKQKTEALGSTGIGFIPHVLPVKTGEDVASKIMAFSQNGPRAVCVLSASGAIANVTLRQAATSGGTATYEGRYDILSLSGSFMLMEVNGQKSRTGGLSITLAGSDGRVFGGCVAGVLLAATPVQVIVGSFLADGRQEPRPPANHMEPLSVAPIARMNMGGTGGGGSSSPSRGTMSGSSGGGGGGGGGGGAGSPFNHSSGNNNLQGMPGLPWK